MSARREAEFWMRRRRLRDMFMRGAGYAEGGAKQHERESHLVDAAPREVAVLILQYN